MQERFNLYEGALAPVGIRLSFARFSFRLWFDCVYNLIRMYLLLILDVNDLVVLRLDNLPLCVS